MQLVLPRPSRRPLVLTALAWALFPNLPVAVGHEAQVGDLIIGHPWAEPAAAGATTRLFLFICNDEPRDVHILDLSTPVADRTELHFRSNGEDWGTLSSRSVRANESLNVASNHMWFDLHGLTRDLAIGEQFPATLTLAYGRQLALNVVVARKAPAREQGKEDS